MSGNPFPNFPNDIVIPGQAEGDILYYDGASWVPLAPGVAAQVLQTNGPGLLPSWENASAGGLNPQQPDISHDPIGLWTFDGNLFDTSGNDRDFNLVSGVLRYTSGMIPGSQGLALYTNLYRMLDELDDPVFRIAGDITISFAWRPNTLGGSQEVVAQSGSGETEPSDYMWGAYQKGRQTSFFWESGGGTNYEFVANSPAFVLGGYQYVTYKRESNVISFYLNGIPVAESGIMTGPTGGSTTKITIGASADGALASLKIVAAPLTDPQILAGAQRVLGITPA